LQPAQPLTDVAHNCYFATRRPHAWPAEPDRPTSEALSPLLTPIHPTYITERACPPSLQQSIFFIAYPSPIEHTHVLSTRIHIRILWINGRPRTRGRVRLHQPPEVALDLRRIRAKSTSRHSVHRGLYTLLRSSLTAVTDAPGA
jgi:hypothetical protein